MTQRKMKDSGVAWIGQVPEGWKVFPLKYGVTKIGSGKTPLGGAEVYTDEGVLFLRSQNVYDDGLLLDDVKRIPCEIDNGMLGTRVVPGDVLLNITGGSIGRCCLYALDEKANVNQHVCIIRTRRDLLTNRFVRYYFNGFKENIVEDNQQGGNRESLNFEQIGNLRLPLPPLAEQRKIAAFLDGECGKIDVLRGKVEKQIAALEEYRKSVITEAVTKGIRRGRKMKPSGVEWFDTIPTEWSCKRIKFFCYEITDGSHFSPQGHDDGFPYVTATDVRGVGIDFSKTIKISEEDYQQLVRSGCSLKKDDVLLVKDGATTGRVGYMTDNTPSVALSSVAMLRSKPNCSKFLMYVMMSNAVQEQILLSMAGSAMPRTTVSKIGGYYVTEPPIPEQREIAAYLDRKCAAIDSMVAKCREELDRLAEYKKSLIYEYVTGKKEVA